MTAAFAALLSLIALVLHAIWEFAQCLPFYAGGRFPMTLAGMLQAVAGDVVLTWLICGAAIGLSRTSCAGPGPVRWRELAVLAGIGAALATGVELHALSAGRRQYSERMPVIPGIDVGLLPVVQLMLLPALTLWLARWAVRRRPQDRHT